ncbi:MAG: PAS domain-containing protein [Glycocaulis sp.]
MASPRTFEHAFHALPGACALVGDDGRILAANARFRAMFGTKGETGNPLSGLYLDPLDAMTARWQRRALSGNRSAPEFVILANAQNQPMSARLTLTELEPGIRLASIEPASDAGRHREGMDRIRRQVGAAFESGSAGAFSVDFASRQVVVSGLLDRFFGPQTGHEPVPLARWLSVIHPDDLADIRRTLAQMPHDPLTVVTIRCRMRTEAGVWVWMLQELRVVERSANGTPLRITGLIHDIAADGEQRAAGDEAALRLGIALEGLDLSTWEFDFDTLEGVINGPVNAVLGADPGPFRISEQALRTRLHPDDAEQVHAAFMGLQFGGRYDETFRLLSPEGYWLWYRSWGKLQTNAGTSGRAGRAFGFWQQIPGQRDDIAVPLESDIASVLERSGLSGWSYDYSTRRLTVSGPVRSALGLDPSETVMSIEEWRARVHPADHAAMDAASARLVATGSAHVEYRVRTAGGNWIWLSLRGGISAQTADGEPLRLSGVFAEATRRKEAERQLAESERLLSQAMFAATMGAWELDADTGTFRPHGGLRAFFGLEDDRDWAPVSVWREKIHPDDIEALDATFKAIMSDEPGKVRAIELRMLNRADGSYIWVEARGSRLGPESERADIAGIIIDISDRKALEASLADSQARLARALASARQGTWRLDFRTGRVELSEFTRRIMGLHGREERPLTLDEWRELIHPEDVHICELGVEGMTRGEPLNAIYRVNSEDGSVRWVEDRGAISARDENSAPLEAIGTLVDITRRRELELELEEREQRLNEAMDAGLSAIWSIDHETGEQSVRGRLLEWMSKGIGTDRIGLEDWNRIIHPDDREVARKALAELMQGNPGGPVDYRLRFGDSWRWVRAKGEITARDKAGNPVRSGGVVVDITAEREYAAALEVERERLNQIYRTTPVMMISLNPAGTIVGVSQFWLDSLGYRREDVIGKSYQAFLTPASVENLQTLGGMEMLLKEGSMRDILARLVKADGEEIDIVSSATVEYAADGTPVAAHGISIDVTRQLAQARELKRYSEELERTNRELDRFATVASHDLQEPLRKISAFASLIKRRHHGTFDHETNRSLDFLVDAAGRMRRLIDDLLTYSRASKRALEYHSVDMEQTVSELLTELEILVNEAKAGIVVGPLPVIEGDPTLLRLLIQNLITNALKYRKGEGVEISISAVNEHTHWRFTVADNGIGFDPRFSEKIFAPFQRLHGREEYDGTGIGLAICQQAVERHGGRIWVESEPGSGSRFHFTLPAGRPAASDAA